MSIIKDVGFLTPLDVRRLNGRLWQLKEPLIYRSLDRTLYKVNAGMVTDFGTARFFRINFLSYMAMFSPATVLHDDRYQRGDGTRLAADKLLLEALDLTCIGSAERYLAYYVVRALGGPHWTKHPLKLLSA